MKSADFIPGSFMFFSHRLKFDNNLRTIVKPHETSRLVKWTCAGGNCGFHSWKFHVFQPPAEI